MERKQRGYSSEKGKMETWQGPISAERDACMKKRKARREKKKRGANLIGGVFAKSFGALSA